MKKPSTINLVGCKKFGLTWSEKEREARELMGFEKRVSDDPYLSSLWKDFFLITIDLKRMGVIKDRII